MPDSVSSLTHPKQIDMKNLFFIATVCICLVACSHTVYVVRHAEKVSTGDSLAKMMATDPPLSEAGKVRALVLRDELRNKHIRHIYTTNTLRTRLTAGPLSQALGVKMDVYGNVDSLVDILRSERTNALVVAHSNTVDDIINKLAHKTSLAGDLGDAEYDNLFMVRFKGRKIFFDRRKFGYPSNP